MRISDWSSDVCSSDLTVHHDDLVRKLHERETDIAIAVEVPRNAPVGSRWLGEGELVVLYREEDMPAAPSRLELADLKGHRFISVASSGPIGEIFVCEQQRLGLALDKDRKSTRLNSSH